MKAKMMTRETIGDLGKQDRVFPEFAVGDVIAVSQRIKEGDKERLQVFEGDVIAIKNRDASSSFIVRKIGANSVAVERIFPFHSPLIESIRFIRKGKARRAKLFYMRDRIGKAARVKEDISARQATRERRAGEAAAEVADEAAE